MSWSGCVSDESTCVMVMMTEAQFPAFFLIVVSSVAAAGRKATPSPEADARAREKKMKLDRLAANLDARWSRLFFAARNRRADEQTKTRIPTRTKARQIKLRIVELPAGFTEETWVWRDSC